MSLSEIVGHEQAIQALRHAVEADRLATAYLFVGPPNAGKTLAAKELAKAVNCEEPPEGPPDGCGQCHACVRIEQENHPDVRVVRPSVRVRVTESREDALADGVQQHEGATLKRGAQDVYVELPDAVIYLEQVRELTSQAHARRASARRKFLIIAGAESLRYPEAPNALLKTLEEPPPDTTFILTTSRPERLLDTIHSRCQTVRFQPLANAEMRRALAERFPDADEQLVLAVTAMAGGRYGRALRLMEAPELVELRGELLDVAAAAHGARLGECLAWGERVMEMPQRWWEAEQQVQAREGVASERQRLLRERALEELAGNSPDRIRRIQMNQLLDILQTWYRDLTLLRGSGGSELVINADRREQLEELAADYSPAGLAWASEVIEQARRDLTVHNANLRLACQVLMVKLIAARRRG